MTSCVSDTEWPVHVLVNLVGQGLHSRPIEVDLQLPRCTVLHSGPAPFLRDEHCLSSCCHCMGFPDSNLTRLPKLTLQNGFTMTTHSVYVSMPAAGGEMSVMHMIETGVPSKLW